MTHDVCGKVVTRDIRGKMVTHDVCGKVVTYNAHQVPMCPAPSHFSLKTC